MYYNFFNTQKFSIVYHGGTNQDVSEFQRSNNGIYYKKCRFHRDIYLKVFDDKEDLMKYLGYEDFRFKNYNSDHDISFNFIQ